MTLLFQVERIVPHLSKSGLIQEFWTERDLDSLVLGSDPIGNHLWGILALLYTCGIPCDEFLIRFNFMFPKSWGEPT